MQEINKFLKKRDKKLFQELFNKSEKSLIEKLIAKILNYPINEVKDNIYTDVKVLAFSKKMDSTSNLLVLYKDEFILFKFNSDYDGKPLDNITEALNLVNASYQINDNTKSFCKTLNRGVLINLNWYSKNLKKEKIAGKTVTTWNYPENDELSYQGYCLKIININLEYYVNTMYEDIPDDEKVFKLFALNYNDLENIVKDIPELDNYISRIKKLFK